MRTSEPGVQRDLWKTYLTSHFQIEVKLKCSLEIGCIADRDQKSVDQQTILSEEYYVFSGMVRYSWRRSAILQTHSGALIAKFFSASFASNFQRENMPVFKIFPGTRSVSLLVPLLRGPVCEI